MTFSSPISLTPIAHLALAYWVTGRGRAETQPVTATRSMVDPSTCTLYELYDAQYSPERIHRGFGRHLEPSFERACGRPAGRRRMQRVCPILPGLVRYDEVESGSITHAIRMTAETTDTSYLWPARHEAGARSDPNLPPRGARFRLKASFDISGFSPQARVVLRAMQQYGLILADNGSNWYFGGTADPSWPQSLVDELKQVPAERFEAVDESSLMVNPDQVRREIPGPVTGIAAAALGIGLLALGRRGRSLRSRRAELRLHGEYAAQRADQPHRLDP